MNRAWADRDGLRRLWAVRLFLAWLAVGLIPLTCLADQTYVIKRGDTLSGIARKHGISASVLAERNGLSRNAHVYAGQRLIVPTKPDAPRKPATTAAPAPTRTKLPTGVQRAISRAPVGVGRWKHIVIHHSGVDTGSVKGMDRYHREVRHMENGLAYHFVIGNGNGMGDGEVSVGRRWINQLAGGHLASEAQNQVAIGICLVGNFDRRAPTAKQMQSLRALVEALLARCRMPVSAVKTHQQINVIGTRCPGTRFPAKTFTGSLKAPAP